MSGGRQAVPVQQPPSLAPRAARPEEAGEGRSPLGDEQRLPRAKGPRSAQRTRADGLLCDATASCAARRRPRRHGCSDSANHCAAPPAGPAHGTRAPSRRVRGGARSRGRDTSWGLGWGFRGEAGAEAGLRGGFQAGSHHLRPKGRALRGRTGRVGWSPALAKII